MSERSQTVHKQSISKDSVILDVVCEHQETVEVFSRYDDQAGQCICCNSLFDTIETMTKKYGINTDTLIQDLKNTVSSETA